MDKTLDGGPICTQSEIEVTTKDVNKLEEQIHKIEHEIYPLVIKQIADGKMAFKDGKVIKKWSRYS